MKYVSITIIVIVALFMEIGLWNMWNADKSYAFGKNYNSVSQYITAYPFLLQAVNTNPNEPTFRDELAYNQAVLASAINTQILSATDSAIATYSAEQKLNLVIPQLGVSTKQLIDASISNSNVVIESSPNSLPFWKSRTKTFYQLSTLDPKYNVVALDSIKRAAQLAPTDAKISYNLALLLGRNGQVTQAVKQLEKTLQLKPDYPDAKETLELYQNELKKP